MNLSIDVRHLLPQIRVPTLVMNRRGDAVAAGAAGRYMADRIAGSRFVEFEGDDHLLWVGDSAAICREIEAFLGALQGGKDSGRLPA